MTKVREAHVLLHKTLLFGAESNVCLPPRIMQFAQQPGCE